MRYMYWEYRVPLFDKDRRVRAWALVDEDDYWGLLGFRWCLTAGGYAGRYDREHPSASSVRMHRELLGLVRGDGVEVDHVNRDRLDNRRENLRIVGRQGNAQNLPSYTGTSSRFRGVSFNRQSGKWTAQHKLNRKYHYLGSYATEQEAADAARAFRLEHMPGAVD